MSIEQEVVTRIGVLRSILRYIQTPAFNEFYNQYPDQQHIETLIAEGNKQELAKLLKEYVHGPLYSKPLRTLREQARNAGIANWYHLTKPTLVRLLERQ